MSKKFPADQLPAPVISEASNSGDTHLITLAANTITSETDGGYKQTRPRNTRIKETMTYTWTCLTDDQLNVLRNFFKSVGTYDQFDFTDYSLKETHAVRFTDNLSCQYYHPMGWSVTLKFEEV